MQGDCCPGKSASKRLIVEGQEVGVSGLDEIISKGLENLDKTDSQQRSILMTELTSRNYVPPSVKESYLEAIWVHFKGERAKKLGWVEENYPGARREDIKWFPSIDSSKCDECGACAKFCKRGVYTFNGVPHVTNPYRCVVGCTGCEKECKAGAISFPTLVDLRKMIKILRDR